MSKEKEKAIELVEKYKPTLTQYGVSDNFAKSDAKQCALICVDEILNEMFDIHGDEHDYWQNVRKEIESL